MKAIVVSKHGGPEELNLRDVPEPVPGPDQVLIRVVTTGVNFADIMSRQGRFQKNVPFIPGTDVSGVIEQIGENVSNLQVGQHVMAFSATGSYAEKVVADSSMTFHIPESIDFDLAGAMLVVGTTAYNIVMNVAKIKKGESVLIHAAAGGVGSTAIQLAKLQGATKIIGTVGSNDKIQFVKDLGADEVINYREENFAERVLSLTDGKGVDVILDSVSGDVFEQGLNCLAIRGRIVVYSHAGGRSGTVTTSQLNPGSRSILGYSMRNNSPEETIQTVNIVIKLIQNGDIRFIIGKKFDLSQAYEAHQWVENRQNIGKTLIKIKNA
ncbi:quinone oxidoreductase [Neobacillus niacini]|uniref:quinone oxidoreductase family protein n=1 Tax=Neobacillus niacini TaxID=86668 RepID=UPI003002D97C